MVYKSSPTIGIPIGIVTAIAAPASLEVDFEGNGGHAGAVLMPARLACSFILLWFTFLWRISPYMYVKGVFYRNDAGLAAAELALAVEKHVLESGSIDTVGTVGMFYKPYLAFYIKSIIPLCLWHHNIMSYSRTKYIFLSTLFSTWSMWFSRCNLICAYLVGLYLLSMPKKTYHI